MLEGKRLNILAPFTPKEDSFALFTITQVEWFYHDDAVVFSDRSVSISLIWIRKRTGPRTVPSGTPDTTGVRGESLPSTTTVVWH